MSTKNLARTVIEGGRARYNKIQRYHSHAQQRRAEHMVSSRLLCDSELDDVVYPARERVYQGFDDKLGPAERFLESQIGRPWNKVRSELFARFDSRTTAGRHVLFCHLLRSVITGVHERVSFWRDEFTVDAHGILRRLRRAPWLPLRAVWHDEWRFPLPERRDVLDEWLAGRRVGERTNRLYWFVQTPTGAFRQQYGLRDAEVARWRALPQWYRDLNDAFNLASLRTRT
jgi:hypothetical protein